MENKDIIIDKEEEENIITDLFNIYLIHYKSTHALKSNETMFDKIDVDDEKATNEILESFYAMICDYQLLKQKGDKYSQIYTTDKINQDDFKTIYALLIDDKINIVAGNEYILIDYLIDLDWLNIKWKIIKIK